LNDRYNFEGQVDILANAICHELKGAVWRHECNGSVSVKAPQTHTLMKLDIVYLDSTVLCLGWVCILDEEFVVDSELAFWHT